MASLGVSWRVSPVGQCSRDWFLFLPPNTLPQSIIPNTLETPSRQLWTKLAILTVDSPTKALKIKKRVEAPSSIFRDSPKHRYEVHMKSRTSILAITVVLAASSLLVAQDENGKADTERTRIQQSGDVLKQILDMPDKGIPKSVLNGAKCVIVLPSVKKVAIGIGGTYGRGVMSCRTGADYKGDWSAPIMMASGGGNIGFQLGGQATDFVIIVMNDQGAKSLLTNKVKLGADASVAAGPVGRTAEASTNASMQAQMLSYSRSRGIFGGVSLSGATLRPDGGANENLYGRKVSAKEIIAGKVSMPPEAEGLISQLQRSQTAQK